MPSFLDRCIYELTRVQTYLALSIGFSFRFEGGRNVPRKGRALILSNHESFLDPPVIGLSTTRPLHYLARKTLFTPRFGRLIRALNAVPVDQEGVAKEGLKTVIDLLNQDKAVVIFPEGERTLTGHILPFKPGIQLILKKTNAPIVPVGIAGAYDALPRARPYPTFSPFFMPAGKGSVAVSVGKPLAAKPFIDMPREQMLKELQTIIQDQKDRAQKLRRKA
jgi:1-acyl-sn-glycerol-3-phosphate acyltransferase